MTDPDHVACDACGRVEHIDLLDAKPDDPSNPVGCDWNRLECIACYGPGWLPGGDGNTSVSICDELHGLYLGFRLKCWFSGRWRALKRRITNG